MLRNPLSHQFNNTSKQKKRWNVGTIHRGTKPALYIPDTSPSQHFHELSATDEL